MNINNDVVEAIGNTPLIKLKRASEETGCNILGKAEFMNPGQSVKDRAALFIIRDAINRTMLEIQREERAELDRRSTIRKNDFMYRLIKIFAFVKVFKGTGPQQKVPDENSAQDESSAR